jgi:hypothetical protein
LFGAQALASGFGPLVFGALYKWGTPRHETPLVFYLAACITAIGCPAPPRATGTVSSISSPPGGAAAGTLIAWTLPAQDANGVFEGTLEGTKTAGEGLERRPTSPGGPDVPSIRQPLCGYGLSESPDPK